MKSKVLAFSFVACALRVISKNSLPNLRSQRLTTMLSSKSFTVTIFPFSSMIHCELIFVDHITYGPKVFILFCFHMDIQLS